MPERYPPLPPSTPERGADHDVDEGEEEESGEAALLRIVEMKLDPYNDRSNAGQKVSLELQELFKWSEFPAPHVDLVTGGSSDKSKLVRTSDGAFVRVLVWADYDVDKWSAKKVDRKEAETELRREKKELERLIAEQQAKLDAMKKFMRESFETEE